MKKVLFIVSLLVITLLLKPRKEILIAIKWVYRTMAIKIEILLATLYLLTIGIIGETKDGVISFKLLLLTFIIIVLFKACSSKFFGVADYCSIQIETRFGAKK